MVLLVAAIATSSFGQAPRVNGPTIKALLVVSRSFLLQGANGGYSGELSSKRRDHNVLSLVDKEQGPPLLGAFERGSSIIALNNRVGSTSVLVLPGGQGGAITLQRNDGKSKLTAATLGGTGGCAVSFERDQGTSIRLSAGALQNASCQFGNQHSVSIAYSPKWMGLTLAQGTGDSSVIRHASDWISPILDGGRAISTSGPHG